MYLPSKDETVTTLRSDRPDSFRYLMGTRLRLSSRFSGELFCVNILHEKYFDEQKRIYSKAMHKSRLTRT